MTVTFSRFLVKGRRAYGDQIVISQVEVVLEKQTRHSLGQLAAVARVASRTEWQRIGMWFYTFTPDQSGPTISPSTTSFARSASRVCDCWARRSGHALPAMLGTTASVLDSGTSSHLRSQRWRAHEHDSWKRKVRFLIWPQPEIFL